MRQVSYEKIELIACAEGRLFGESNARLPMPPMLMLDRITRIADTGGYFGKGEVIAELDIDPELWFFQCHFPTDPVMPGCLGLDAMWQLVGFFLGWRGNLGRGRALGVGNVKFTGQVLPKNHRVRYHLHIKRIVERNLSVAIADGEMFVDDVLIYTAQNLRCGVFIDNGI